MKKILSLFVLCMSIYVLPAQDINEVSLVVMGDGANKEEATRIALRSAIEQAYGAFVSVNTQILNDEVVKDEIITISSGNIQKFEELSCVQLDNGKTLVTLNATVSLTKLVSYAKSKGAECEFAGATFGANVKLAILNRANAIKALDNLIEQIKMIDNFYDYELKIGEPYIKENSCHIPWEIDVRANNNTKIIDNMIHSTLKAILLSEQEYNVLKNIIPLECVLYKEVGCNIICLEEKDFSRGDYVEKYYCYMDNHDLEFESSEYRGGCIIRYLEEKLNSYLVSPLRNHKIVSNTGEQWIFNEKGNGHYLSPHPYLQGFHIKGGCRGNRYNSLLCGLLQFPYYNDYVYYAHTQFANHSLMATLCDKIVLPIDELSKITGFSLQNLDGTPVTIPIRE